MTDLPMLYCGQMVRAILDDLKTNTRRKIKTKGKHVELISHIDGLDEPGIYHVISSDAPREVIKCPYWVGRRLWVRESAWITPLNYGTYEWVCNSKDSDGHDRLVTYKATAPADSPELAKYFEIKLTPSIFMPRWASRLSLEVVDIRPERLQDIDEAGAIDEGCKSVDEFKVLWDSLNGKKAPWESSPWIWRIAFRRIEG